MTFPTQLAGYFVCRPFGITSAVQQKPAAKQNNVRKRRRLEELTSNAAAFVSRQTRGAHAKSPVEGSDEEGTLPERKRDREEGDGDGDDEVAKGISATLIKG